MASPAGPSVTLIAATSLECKALRRELPEARIVQVWDCARELKNTARRHRCELRSRRRIADGSPDRNAPDSTARPRSKRNVIRCDDELVEALTQGARSLGIEPVFDPAPDGRFDRHRSGARNVGDERLRGSRHGDRRIAAPRVAAVRVVLDTPHHELSAEWRTAAGVLKPSNWPEACRGWHARRRARQAGRFGAWSNAGIGGGCVYRAMIIRAHRLPG